MKSSYLASVDLDATFIRSDRSISEHSKNFVQEFVKNGNHFIINTGRPQQSAKHFLKEIGIHEPVIVNNGTAIVWFNDDYDTVVNYITFHMDINLVKSFIKEAKPLLDNVYVSTLFDMYSFDMSRVPFWCVHEDPSITFHNGEVEEILSYDPIKIEYYVKEEKKDEFERLFNSPSYKDQFEYIFWGVHDGIATYEVSKKGVNKGYAMEYISEKLGIPKQNIMSFGDQLNDVPMIIKAHYGVAMINSRDEVKALSKFVSTYDNNNEGVVNFIQDLVKD